jgi:hypothetical protein
LRWINSILNAMANAIWVTEQARMSLQPVGYKGASSPKKACGPICAYLVSNGSIKDSQHHCSKRDCCDWSDKYILHKR